MWDSSLIWESYKKIIKESITATVAGLKDDHRTSNTTLLEIKYHTLNKAIQYQNWSEFEREYFQQNRSTEMFTPDGSSSGFDPTGVINFYTSGLLPDVKLRILDNIEKSLSSKGFKFFISDPEKSGLSGKEVYRIKINHNPFASIDIDAAPEVKFSNTNMISVLNALGLDDIAEEYGGLVDVDELLLLIRNVSGKSMEQQSRPRYHSDMEKFKNPGQEQRGATIIDQGLSSSDIQERINMLYDLAVWAKKHNYKTLSFG
jgi:hypothetical protein